MCVAGGFMDTRHSALPYRMQILWEEIYARVTVAELSICCAWKSSVGVEGAELSLPLVPVLLADSAVQLKDAVELRFS